MDYFTRSLAETIVGGIVSSLFVVLLLAVFGKKRLTNALRRIRAHYVKPYSGDAFSILLCDIEGDDDGRIGSLLRANIELNYAAEGKASGEPVDILAYPLRLPAAGGDKNRKKAKQWLLETNRDVIIWGELGAQHDQLVLKAVGRNFSPTRAAEVGVTVEAGEFNELIATAVTREIVNIQTEAFDHPARLDIKTLARIAQRRNLLIFGDIPGSSKTEKASLHASLGALLLEITRRASNLKVIDLGIDNALKHLQLIDEKHSPVLWAKQVGPLCFFAIQRAWAGLPRSTHDAIFEKVSLAYEIFERYSLSEEAYRVSIELGWLTYFDLATASGYTVR